MFKSPKIGGLALLILHFALSTVTLFAQNVSFTAHNEPLSAVLQKLSTEYDAKIAFDGDLASKIIVSGKFTNVPITTAIAQLLQDTMLEVILIGDVIVIRPRIAVAGEELPEPIPPPPVEYRISGIIRDYATREHLPYATVAFPGTSQGVSANVDGYFTLFSKETDSVTLQFSYIGYTPKVLTVHPPTQSGQLIVELNTMEIFIPDAIISQRQPDMVTTEPIPGLFRWNSNRNTDIPSLNGLDIAAPLQLLPGIDGTTESLSGLIIRKLPSDKNLFVFDGFTIYHIDHFFGAFTSFNAKSVKDIRVFKSGFDARWGGSASSVIEITGKTGNANALSVDAGVDLLSADVLVEGPIGSKVTFLIAGRRSITDFYRSGIYYKLFESARSDIVQSSNVFPSFLKVDVEEPSLTYYDANAKVAYRPTEKDLASVSLFVGGDIMNLERDNPNQYLAENSDWGNSGAGFRWSRQWTQRFDQVLNIGLSKYNLNYFHSDSTLRRRENVNVRDTIIRSTSVYNRLNDINFSLTNNFKIGKGNDLQFGVQQKSVSMMIDESLYQSLNSIDIIDTARVRNQDMNLSTIWGQHIYSHGIIKTLKYGLRANYYEPTGKYYIEPRAQLSITLTPKAYLKFSAGKYYQFVNKVLTYSTSSFRSVWTVSDGDRFPVVSSKHYTAGALFRFPKSLTLDIEGYIRNTQDIVTVQTVLRRESGVSVRQEQIFNSIDNKTIGLDMMLHKEFGFAQAWIAYTLSRSINQSDNINRGNAYPSLYDQLHEVKIASTGRWKDWGYSFAAIFGSGKPWDEPLFTTNFQLASDYEKNSNRLPPYLRLDIGFSYARKVNGVDLKAGVNVFNLLNKNNILSRVYTLSGTPLITYLDTGTPLIYSDIMGMGIAQMVYFNVKF